jgi:hypothetical protein
VALFRAVSGAASEKFPQNNPLVQDLAFAYRVVPEVFTLAQPAPDTNHVSAVAYAQNLESRLHEVRLKYAWPVLPRGNFGNGRQTFRTMVGGRLQSFSVDGHPVFFFNPGVY